MNGRNVSWIPWVVTFFLVLAGVVAAVRGQYMLSGTFALYFVGYSIIRLSTLLRRPTMQTSPALRLLGFLLVIAATFFFLYWYLFKRI